MRKILRTAFLLIWLIASYTSAWAVGNALRFNAANSSYVQIARPAAIQGDFTIEYWVNTTMTGPTGTNWWQGAGLVDGEVAGAVNDFGTSLLNGGKLAFGVGNPDVTIQSTTAINDGTWHHVAVTRTQASGLMQLYIDGALQVTSGTAVTNTGLLTAPVNLRLGSIQTGAPYFTGQLDEVRLWSVVRTQAQISTNKNYLVASGTANLAAYYRLDEGTGTSAGGTGAGAAGTLLPAATPPTWVVPSTAPIYGIPTVSTLQPTSGPVGTSVVITGTNFTGATGVTFNGTAATAYTVNSDTQITATVPGGATTGTVSVANPAGTGTSTGSFTVTVPPTVGPISGTIRRNNVRASITVLSATSGTPTGYLFTSLPTAAGTLIIANAAITAYQAAAVNTLYTPQQISYLSFQAPTSAAVGTVTFGFQAQNAVGSSNTGTYSLTVQPSLPTVVSKAAPIIPKSFGATAIKPLQGAADASTTIATYRILTLPSGGTLYVNGTAVTAAPTDVAAANAGTLAYDPDATKPAGNYVFTYQATDNAGGVSASATFSLPVSNADCGQNSAVDFSARTVGEDWKAQTGVTVVNTTVSSNNYASSVPAGQTNTLAIGPAGNNSTQSLMWQLDNKNFAGNNASTVQLNFSRPVRNLAFGMEDIDISSVANGDGSDFIDEVTFNAYTLGSTTPYQLAAADVALGQNGANTFVAGTNTIKGVAVSNGPGSTVVLTYPPGIAISRLEIVYRNTQTYTAGNTRLQTVGIQSMVWCAEVDLITTLTGPTQAPASQTVTYTAVTKNQGDISAAGVQSTVQLSPNLQNVTAPTGFNYTAGTGLLTLAAIGTLGANATSTSPITFTMPATGPVTGQDNSTTTGLDVEPANNNGSLAPANVSTVQNQAPVANNVTVSPSIDANSGPVAIPALSGTDPEGNNTIASYTITSALPPASQGTLYVNGVVLNTSNFPGLVLTPAQATQLTFDPSGTYLGNVTFQYTVTDNLGLSAASPATYLIPVTETIGGTVFEDVNYGGGAGRDLGPSAGVGRGGARVELYNGTGSTAAFAGFATTDANGAYAFSGLAAGSSYVVRVVNSSVTSSRTGYVAALLPVQTYVYNNASRVGGESPALADAGSGGTTLGALTTGTTDAESIVAVALASTTAATANLAVNFGFNFDAVVNTNDAGQGSLRQFILNSNALGGEGSLAQVYTSAAGASTALAPALETSIFMIPNGTAVAGQRAGQTNKFAATAGGTATTIQLISAALPAITGPATAIDGSTQTRSTGDSNAPVTTAGGESTGPEVLLDLNALGKINISANNDQVVGLGITNGTTAQGILISNNATGALIKNNTINNNKANITFNGSSVASAATITGNVIRNSIAATADGIELNGNNSNMTISNNQILRNAGFGIDFIGGANTGNLITGNTFAGNGTATTTDQLSGIGLRSTGSNNNNISLNTFTANSGAGIVAKSGTTGNVFSQNSFSGNGTANKPGLGLAIDLTAAATTSNNGDGVTKNADGKTATSGANGLLNFPVFTQATIFNGNLLVTGYAKAGALIELFVASADPSGFGEGATYIAAATEGSVDDSDNRSATYSGVVGNTGLDQGSESSAQAFRFSIPVSTALGNSLVANKLTATATLPVTVNGLAVGNTSEFSGNITVSNNLPLPVELVAFEVRAAKADAQLTWTTASEKNNDHFDVERSFDGTGFAKIAAVAGQGSKSSSTDYALADAGVAAKATGPVYYRLRQVDADGTTAFSPVRTVAFGKTAASAIALHPNPAAATTQLDLGLLPAGTYQVSLLDLAGRAVLDLRLPAGLAHPLDLAPVASGSYVVRVRGTAADGTVVNLATRFVKE